ncbi:O-antigen ligase family protein [Bacillus sp. REN10]|uniref:O-antigen ligase family protein n=1 Tax=Bacillus sp. REN10 TaxID=2782541 RepID=UPI00193C1F5C|nr:O-antigen ligase family protein [Bacillus sp. REN10]
MADFFRNNILFVFSVCLMIAGLLLQQSVIGLTVSVLLALVAFVRPKAGLSLLLIYFPLRSFIIEVNPAMKITGDIIVLAALFHVIWLGRKDIKSLFQFAIYEWAFFFFIALGSISALFSDVSIPAIIFQVRAFMITYFLYYIVKRLDIDKEDVKKFFWITIVVATVVVIQGLVEKISGRTLLMPETWVNTVLSPTNRVRIYGLINNPNRLAVYLSFAMMAVFYFYDRASKGKKVSLAILAILFAGTGMLTYSRGTAIAFGIGLVIYWLLTRHTNTVIRLVAVGAISFVVVLYPVNQLTQWVANSNFDFGTNTPGSNNEVPKEGFDQKERLKETFDQNTIELSKTSGRLFIVTKGLEIFRDHFIMGTGFATFGDSATKSYLSPIYEKYEIPSHIYADNQYIQVMAQTGILGVITFAVFLLGMLIALWKNRQVNKEGSFLMISILLGIFALGTLYNIWEDKTFTTYYFMMLAYVLHHQRDSVYQYRR